MHTCWTDKHFFLNFRNNVSTIQHWYVKALNIPDAKFSVEKYQSGFRHYMYEIISPLMI